MKKLMMICLTVISIKALAEGESYCVNYAGHWSFGERVLDVKCSVPRTNYVDNENNFWRPYYMKQELYGYGLGSLIGVGKVSTLLRIASDVKDLCREINITPNIDTASADILWAMARGDEVLTINANKVRWHDKQNADALAKASKLYEQRLVEKPNWAVRLDYCSVGDISIKDIEVESERHKVKLDLQTYISTFNARDTKESLQWQLESIIASINAVNKSATLANGSAATTREIEMISENRKRELRILERQRDDLIVKITTATTALQREESKK